MNKLEAVSLFSGCGGFDLGLKKLGVDIIWANDINRAAASAYKSIFPDVEFVEDDIRNITSIPPAEILIGCYPCTGFSQAAKRRWKDRGDRDLKLNSNNFLFKEFLRAIEIVRPKVVFIENVQGMLSASNGYFWNEQKEGLKSLGFNKLWYKLINAQDYGLAQSRKRVFIVGFHNTLKDKEYNFPDKSHGGEYRWPLKTMKDVIGGMPEWPTGEFCTSKFHGHYLTRNRKRSWDEPSYTIVASASHVPLHPMGEPMMKVGKDQWTLQGRYNRRLSWKECAMLQGLPTNLKIEGTLESKYKVVGNSVPPMMSEVIARQVIEQL